MYAQKEHICPTCHGKRVVNGHCECNSEWRGNLPGERNEDCRCFSEEPCPTCHGEGEVKAH